MGLQYCHLLEKATNYMQTHFCLPILILNTNVTTFFKLRDLSCRTLYAQRS